MDEKAFEHLLWRDESETLDFKAAQYPFVKATADERSELVKDIVGFVNAWRQSDAYILIGVRDVRGGRSEVIGIPGTAQLDDNSLQQFMRSATDQPVLFRYEAFNFEGRQVGIITIDEQARPVRMAKNIGPLKRNEVYVRRGSMTDPTRPATEDEIARMIACSRPRNAEIVVELAEVDGDDSLGTHQTLEMEFCEMPSSIPDLNLNRRYGEMVIPVSEYDTNRSYYRQRARYEVARRLLRPVRLLVWNVGRVPARSVRVEVTIQNDGDTQVEGSMPAAPRKHSNWTSPSFRGRRGDPGHVQIDTNTRRFRIAIDCGDLQPRRPLPTEHFYVGKKTSGDVVFRGHVFADNLPRPESLTLTITANVLQTSMTLAELRSLPETD
jgi:schlafen family protein